MTDPHAPLAPGATIGILGGGQLGRMLSVAGSRLGFRTVIFDPAPDCPAAHVALRHIAAPWEDRAALEAFGRAVDVVTYEFENVPADTLTVLAPLVPIHPGRKALSVAQDRLVEKAFLVEQGLATAPFAAVDDAKDLTEAIKEIGTPGILKTRRFGYDGKGQVRIDSPAKRKAALKEMKGASAIYEGFVDFSREVSVIGARGVDGSVACFDPGENLHEGGILRTTTVPARLSAAQRSDAVLIAATILNRLNYVGVVGVELFVTPGGLIVNEFAPRVHNSGHWTQNGCLIDQFEQHIRAIAGWPLGDGSRHADVVMENLIGSDVDRLPDLAREACAIHLYGKAEARPGRKMGHINRILGPS